MTRESLKEYYMSIYNGRDELSSRWKPDIICEQVDLIFDYFENRSCESCKHLDITDKSFKCCNEIGINIGYKTAKEFYCSAWESEQ